LIPESGRVSWGIVGEWDLPGDEPVFREPIALDGCGRREMDASSDVGTSMTASVWEKIVIDGKKCWVVRGVYPFDLKRLWNADIMRGGVGFLRAPHPVDGISAVGCFGLDFAHCVREAVRWREETFAWRPRERELVDEGSKGVAV